MNQSNELLVRLSRGILPHRLVLLHPAHAGIDACRSREHKFSRDAVGSLLGGSNEWGDLQPDVPEAVTEIADEVIAGGWSPAALKMVCDAIQFAQLTRTSDQSIRNAWFSTDWSISNLHLAALSGEPRDIERDDSPLRTRTHWLADRPEGWAAYAIDIAIPKHDAALPLPENRPPQRAT